MGLGRGGRIHRGDPGGRIRHLGQTTIERNEYGIQQFVAAGDPHPAAGTDDGARPGNAFSPCGARAERACSGR